MHDHVNRPIHVSSRPGATRRFLLGGAALFLLASAAVAEEGQPQSSDSGLNEVVVTATRRSEDIRKVPVNVTAYNQEQMDDQGVKSIDDLSRLTPDLNFTHTAGVAGNNSTNISIRGIASDVGAPTTAIYIDDTPIQMRNIGYWNANAFPQVFDLERVEVLRGPQGTLFGAGAEGGAVRFLTPQPSLDTYSGYFRTDLSDTIHGDPSYEAGAAVGGPIIKDKVGFRVSAWGREDGGWIDRVSPDTGSVVDANANSGHSNSARAALTIAPIDDLKITASYYYQNVHNNDVGTYWSTLSHPYAGTYQNGSALQQPTDDTFSLPSLKIQYDFGGVSLFSDTSYFYRRNYAALDYTNYFAGIFDGNALYSAPGDQPSAAYETNFQHGITQETRLQSTDDSWLDWTVGMYYSRFSQNDQDITLNGQYSYTSVYGRAYSFAETTQSADEQLAGYANVDVHVTDKLKLTGGVRVSNVKFNFNQASSFSGAAQGTITGSEEETPITPKFGISYQIDPNNFVYFTAAKGFRPGGANEALNSTLCSSDLKILGLATTPASYQSDSLWSYEVGAKDTLFGGKLFLDSSAYMVKWSNIQQSVRLPTCGFGYVGNLGTATSVGGDVSAHFKLTDSLLMGVSAGYNNTTYDKTIYEGADAILVNSGDAIGGPPFSASIFAQYNFTAFAKDAFIRADYTFHSSTPHTDATVYSYDPTQPGLAENNYLSLRAGIYIGGWEVSIYGNNLTNEQTPLSVAHDIPGSPLYYESSYRPMTFGSTASYHF
jgi:outer membrane receptor protein involved in Fe transport